MQSLKNKTRKLLATKWRKNNVDIMALSHLYSTSMEYMPWTSSSLRPSALVKILNDIILNKKRNIIEFGSGISTIFIAKLIKNIDLDNEINFYSIDHNEDWIDTLKNILSKSGSKYKVRFVLAPMEKSELSINGLNWYNVNSLDKIDFANPFDLILVDGPLAYTKELELSRYPAIPYLYNKKLISNDVSIYLDDIDRVGEEKTVQLLEEKYGYHFVRNYLEGSIAISINGNSFNV